MKLLDWVLASFRTEELCPMCGGIVKAEGNKNSGCHGPKCGRPKGTKNKKHRKDPIRQARAKLAHIPQSKEKMKISVDNEIRIADALGGEPIGMGGHPFDVSFRNIFVEVKTLHKGLKGEAKVHMRKDSRKRKEKLAKKENLSPWTVAIDQRKNKEVVYVREGVGAFRLTQMEPFSNINDAVDFILGG